MIAVLFARPLCTLRSRQLKLRFILPPTNHLAEGRFHSSTLSHGLNQWSSFAIPAQNASGSSMDCLYMASYCSRLLMWACFENSSGGGKTRVSRSVDSRSWFERDETEAGSAGTCAEDMNESLRGRKESCNTGAASACVTAPVETACGSHFIEAG